MITEKPFYKLAHVTCARQDCNETYSVIISSIYDVIDYPLKEIKFNPSKQQNVLEANEFDDYIIITCSCGLEQPVYLKKK